MDGGSCPIYNARQGKGKGMKNRRQLSDRWKQWVCFLMMVCVTACLQSASCAAEKETQETVRAGVFALDGYHAIEEGDWKNTRNALHYVQEEERDQNFTQEEQEILERSSYKAENVNLRTRIKKHPVMTIIAALTVFVICLLAMFLVHLPDLNGIATVRRISRVIGDGKPIMILTAYDWADVEAEAREAGVTAFCGKPLLMSELRDVFSQPFGMAHPEKKKEVNFTGKKVLLVEDNQLNQEIAGTLLKEMGFQVETVDDGSVAVERMKHAIPNQYDLILMDIQMPFMDGYEATKHIRALKSPAAQVPIVAVTANAFSADREKAMACGMNGYLTKPISVKLMVNVLNEVLD